MHHAAIRSQKKWQAIASNNGYSNEKAMFTEMYNISGLSSCEIGKKLDVHSSTVLGRLDRLGIDRRTQHGTEYKESPKVIYEYRTISERTNPYASPCVTCYRKEEDKNICAGTCQTLADFNESCDPCYINAEIPSFHNIGV